MTHGSLFSGIGGFDLAARNVGWTNVFHCEKDEFAGKVLKHHFPEAETFTDIKEFDATPFRGRVQCISGGFPCQPFSAAGKRAGTSDDRHLWPEMLRVISEVMPRWVVGENVRGLLGWGDGTEGTEGMVLNEIVSDLESLGYEVFPTILPACSVEASHRRDRLYVVAYSNHQGESSGFRGVPKTDGEVPERDTHSKLGNTGPADATNADAVRLQQRTDTGEVGRGQSEVRGQGHKPTEPTEATRAARDATNANDQECQRRSSASQCERQEAEQRGHGVLGSVTRLGQESDATYSDGNGFQGGVPTNEHRQQPGTEESAEERVPYGSDARVRFQRFPTQSPVCGGDDGLPTELDGITFSKWRRESIKCYGNAIVVPLVEMIFNAINEQEGIL